MDDDSVHSGELYDEVYEEHVDDDLHDPWSDDPPRGPMHGVAEIMSDRGSRRREFFEEVMEFAMRLPGGAGGVLEEIRQAVADGRLSVPPEPDHPRDAGGFGGVPAAAAAVAGLEKRKYLGHGDGDSECTICMVDYTGDDELGVMPCRHRFHQACIEGWLARSRLCPLYRHELPPEEQDVPWDEL